MEWISIKDRLPGINSEDDAYVLAYGCKFADITRNTAGYCIVASWDGKKWEDLYERNIEDNPDYWGITHWMPLPESPK